MTCSLGKCLLVFFGMSVAIPPCATLGQLANEILSLSPASGLQGVSGLTVTFSLDSDNPPPPPAGIKPTSMTIGTMTGSSITHTQQYTVTAVFAIPTNEPAGLKDASVLFSLPGGGTLTFSAQQLFTVISNTVVPPYPGYNLFAPLGSTNTYLMDNSGHIVHQWRSSYRPGNSVYLLKDGSLLRTGFTGGTNFTNGGAGGRVERLDWSGNLLWAYDYSGDNYRAHHDVAALPNGNILLIAWERKTSEAAIAAGRDPSRLLSGELWPDHVVEIAPTGTLGGTIVWQWHVWDHLIQDFDATKENYGNVSNHPERVDINFMLSAQADWNHINALAYNAELDQIMLSVHDFSEVWIIDHSATTSEAASSTGGRYGHGGDLLYRWGNPQAYRAGVASNQQLFVQHNAHWIESSLPGAGHLLVFNNGQGRPGGNSSSVDEIVLPLMPGAAYSNDLPFAPPAATWSYAATPASSFYASNISGAQRLPNGDTLICNGPTGMFFEVTADGSTVWSYSISQSVFRVTRYGYDYPGLVGTGLNPGEYPGLPYAVVDSAQTNCYNATNSIASPAPGAPFSGQDAQYAGASMSYVRSADGRTVYDQRTGLTWTQTPDLDGNGIINATDKLTYASALAYPDTLNEQVYGGYTDWRLPSIKELYSLMNFSGVDVSGIVANQPVPFVDTNFFAFGYGDTNAGDRVIDAQFASDTLYTDTVMSGQEAMFGLNLADGRIKGYPTTDKGYYVYFVRGNTNYGRNAFVDNGDGTITDYATGLQWQQSDSGTGMNWQNALAYAEALNLAGYQDWRLPNAKELQSILDYTRAPGITGSAAISPIFSCTAITNEAGALDFPWYWSSTTHANSSSAPGQSGVYVCFGRGMGYMNGSWQDVHGAGCQRSDPKSGILSSWTYAPYGYYSSLAPQGDAIRLMNFVRCVRGGATPPTTDSDADGLDDWTEYNYTTNNTAMTPDGDLDNDGFNNRDELRAGTSPVNPSSLLIVEGLVPSGAETGVLRWQSIFSKTYRVSASSNLTAQSFPETAASGIAATPPMNTFTVRVEDASARYYRVELE